MTADQTGRLALLWPRDAPKWHAATPRDYRLSRVFDAITALGIEAEPAFYADDVADQVRSSFSAATACSSGSIHFLRDRTGSPSMRCCGT